MTDMLNTVPEAFCGCVMLYPTTEDATYTFAFTSRDQLATAVGALIRLPSVPFALMMREDMVPEDVGLHWQAGDSTPATSAMVHETAHAQMRSAA